MIIWSFPTVHGGSAMVYRNFIPTFYYSNYKIGVLFLHFFLFNINAIGSDDVVHFSPFLSTSFPSSTYLVFSVP